MTTDIALPRWDHEFDGADVEYDGGNSSSRLFERSRIKALAGERETVQKKTFTKWVNSHLTRVDCKANDLYTDMRDGRYLIKLLEVLSGERLPKPTRGKMRIHCLENVEKALQFLREQRVHLENMGAHDLVDGNPRLTLGLIWTIILRFQIQDITIQEVDSKETKSAKDALLLWCQMKTAGYSNVNVRNFTTSWRDGLAFNAIIHRHRPDLVVYEKMTKSNPLHNLNNAFHVAENQLGLTRLLDAEDVCTEQPDEKSIITYVVTYYHYFSRMRAETIQSKRIGHVVGALMEHQRLIAEYEKLVSSLLRWIHDTIGRLNERQFANSLRGVQEQLCQFKDYRVKQKPPKFAEKGNLEMLLYNIKSKMRAFRQLPYNPSDGFTIADINTAWEELQKAEHSRELALREELIRQEKLEQLAGRFDRKAGMRETWLCENQRLVSQDNFGFDLAAVEASAKKHEAIETDIVAYEERVQAVVSVAQELVDENYHDHARVQTRRDNVLRLWRHLLDLLSARRVRLQSCLELYQNFQEMVNIVHSMEEHKTRLLSTDLGRHLMDVEDLLSKHALIEADINVLGERVKSVVQNCRRFIVTSSSEVEKTAYTPRDPSVIVERVQQLEEAYSELVNLAIERRSRLEESREFWRFFMSVSEEDNFIVEKKNILANSNIGSDLVTVNILLDKHKALEYDLSVHEENISRLTNHADNYVNNRHLGYERIRDRADSTVNEWNSLKDCADKRRNHLEQAIGYHQFFTDADEVNVWMLNIVRMISSTDVGSSEASVQALTDKHATIMQEVDDYYTNIERLVDESKLIGDLYRNNEPIQLRLREIDKRYNDLKELGELRYQRLVDSMAFHKLSSESQRLSQWMDEHDRMLDAIEICEGKDIDDVEIMKQQLHGLNSQLENTGQQLEALNDVADELTTVAQNPDKSRIQKSKEELNSKWRKVLQKAANKQKELDSAYAYETYHIEIRESISWIEEKIKLLYETKDLGSDLSGVMTLQRKLNGMERDVAAIQARFESLEDEARRLEKERPEQTGEIREQISSLQVPWNEMNKLLKDRNARLEEAGDLHRFLRDLDHFSAWLRKTQTDVASEDIPQSLTDAEKLLNQHQTIREEIENYQDDYRSMMEYGESLTADGITPADDAQYMFLRERLKALKHGWQELHQMWENRQQLLSQSLNHHMFLRDAKMGEVALSHQENFLSKIDKPLNLEAAENQVKKFDSFLTSMEANDEKLATILQFAHRLINEDHYASEKIEKKADQISQRRDQNREKAMIEMEKARDQLQLHQFTQDCDELNEWIQEKMHCAQDERYRSAKTLHSKWTWHQAFEAEIFSNKDRLFRIQEVADHLIDEKPEMKDVLKSKVETLVTNFEQLETFVKEKGERLFDANRAQLYDQSCDDIDGWVNHMEGQIINDEDPDDLTSLNILIQKQNMFESEMKIRANQVNELNNQANRLQTVDPARADEIVQKKTVVEARFNCLASPLQARQQRLLRKKDGVQFRRDVEDELRWVDERLLQLECDIDRRTPSVEAGAARGEGAPGLAGDSLVSVHMLARRVSSLHAEVLGHEKRVRTVLDSGRKLVEEGHAQSQLFSDLIGQLEGAWAKLLEAIELRKHTLGSCEKVQQYLFDASEANAWMSEHELYMMVEERGKDEDSAQNLLKRHETLESAVDDYRETIEQLSDTARQLHTDPLSTQVANKQAQIEASYASLKELATERKHRLHEALQLFHLNRDVDDLQQWITEREVVAASQELGQDYDHVCMLQERFSRFCDDTQTVGVERVSAANELADSYIAAGHGDAALCAQWKDQVNEMWADLLELLDTRRQMLVASCELHRFFYTCRTLRAQIGERQSEISERVGQDAGSVSVLGRAHAAYTAEVQAQLQPAVQALCEDSRRLRLAYAGERAGEITAREAEVLQAWNSLQAVCEARSRKLEAAVDLHRFYSLVRTLTMWMDDVNLQMRTNETPKDVSAVELLLSNHQSLKSEISSREESLNDCISLGKQLLSQDHFASRDIREKLLQLSNMRAAMFNQWEERWEYLQLILEVYQFARDAVVAEQWLITQDKYLQNTQIGSSIDEVENIIKKHEAFEKSTAAQEERFMALKRLTTFELRELEKREQREDERRQQEMARSEQASTRVRPSEGQQRQGAPESSHEAARQSTVSSITTDCPSDSADKTTSSEVDSPIYHEKDDTSTQPISSGSFRTKSPKSIRPESSRVTPVLANTSDIVKESTKVRNRSKSPFRSFRFKKSKPETTELTSVSDDEDNLAAVADRPGLMVESGKIQGFLHRKHEWISTVKKASNRSWEKVFVVLDINTISFYKDARAAKTSAVCIHGELPIELCDASVQIATDYSKKKHVFRLKLLSGGEYLFQAHDEIEMNGWISALTNACTQPTGAQSLSKARTLPASAVSAGLSASAATSSGQPDPHDAKKRSFFTLKKK